MALLLQLMSGVGIARPRHLIAVKIGERQLPLAQTPPQRDDQQSLDVDAAGQCAGDSNQRQAQGMGHVSGPRPLKSHVGRQVTHRLLIYECRRAFGRNFWKRQLAMFRRSNALEISVPPRPPSQRRPCCFCSGSKGVSVARNLSVPC